MNEIAQALILGCRLYSGMWSRLKDLGGDVMGPVLHRDLCVNTAGTVCTKD